ncbi:hypothetical protein ABBQ38_012009 [Trebouxia sp. C0009 RCD-2024]
MEETSVSITALPSGSMHQIFGYLPPKDLCCVSATCKHWRELSHDQASNKAWKAFYEQRWTTVHAQNAVHVCWQTEYGSKMKRVYSWSHRHYQQDSLYGHSRRVSCLQIIKGQGLIATGSSDRMVRIWDMQAGMPVATSRLHSGRVCCLAADESMLVSGSSDHKLRVWLADRHSKAGFDLSDPIKLGKNGHTGPVAAVELDNECIYSGSWDYSVRVWHRSSLELAGIVPFDDWVFSLASRGDHLLAGVSSHLLVLDTTTLKPLKTLCHQAGGVVSVEGTRDGRLVFSGGRDGRVLAHDLRLPDRAPPVASLWETSAGVNSLSLEDPWLAAALTDGTVALLNIEAAMRQRQQGRPPAQGPPPKRLFQQPSGAACCADLADQWLAAGSDTGVTYSWDFSKAEEKEEEVRAAKAARGRARQQKAEKHSQRLHHQREKAATTLARLTALHPDAAAETLEHSCSDEHAVDCHQSSAATLRGESDKPIVPEESEQLRNQQHVEHVTSQLDDARQDTRHNQQARQACHLTGAQSMPVADTVNTVSPMRPAPSMVGCDGKDTGCAPLRRLASVAGCAHRQMTVPGPLLHSCSAEACRNSASSMQSWQIVRPRPIQSEKAVVRRPSHVKVQG